MNRAVAVAFVLLAAAPARADELAGEWLKKIEGGEMRLVLKADGSYSFEGQTGTWKREAGKLILAPSDTPGETLAYKLALAGDRLTLSEGDFKEAAVFTRAGAAPASAPPGKDAKPAGNEPTNGHGGSGAEPPNRKDGDAPVKQDEAPSREKQGAPREVKKLELKFKSKTREIKSEKLRVLLPETWTFPQTERKPSGLEVLVCNPGYKQGETAKHQVIFLVNPLKPSEIAKGFKDRVEAGAKVVDEQVFTGWKREKLHVLEAAHGLIARLDYSGEINNQFVRGQKAVGVCAVTQRKNYDVAAVIVSLKEAAGELDDDVLSVLDSIELALPDREVETEKKIQGTWLVPSKTGNTWEQYTLGADGGYRWHYESSYSGQLKDGGGAQTGAWGTASQEDETGRFEIRGDIIYFTSKEKGEQGATFEQGTDEKGKAFLRIGGRKFYR